MSETKISNGSLYNMFNHDELKQKDILPILNLLKVSYEEFLGDTKIGECKEDNMKMKMLEQEIQFLKKQLEDKDTIIQLLKEKKITKAATG